jgi:CubicO group peptidase (beta-lactamase class C family)
MGRHTIFFISLILAARLTAAADRVDDFVKAQMSHRKIPGLVLAIVKDGKPVKHEAYGIANLELNVPVRKDTAFEIGSVTKQFTAAMVLLLVEDGKLSLDDKVTRFFDNAPASWQDITVRHLLTHTSGLRNYTGLAGFEVTKKLTAQKFVATLGAHSLESKPGEAFKYCNSGYNLAGYIIEKVTGKTYWDVLRARILEPLEMRATTKRDLEPIIPNRADGYELKQGKWINRDSDLTDVFAAGAIVSTMGDLLKWNAALDNGRLLSQRSRELMWTGVKLNSGVTYPYGLGWRLDDHNKKRTIWHSGSTSGFTASLLRFPEERLAIIVLCNFGEQATATHVAKGIADLELPRTDRLLTGGQ